MSTLARAVLEALLDDPAALDELRGMLGVKSKSARVSTARTVYTPKTLAAELGITPRAVRAAIARGDLQAAQSGGRWVIGADAVRAWTSPPGNRRRTRARRRAGVMRDALEGGR